MRVLIAGGGTGGHLFPGIALAEEVSTRHHKNSVVFVGTDRGLEARVVPAAGYTLEIIPARGLKGMGLLRLLQGLFTLPAALFASWRILRKYRPDVVVGVGGYASFPVVLCAWLQRVPTAVQEQNALPGLTNRILGRIARVVFISFEEARRWFPAGKSNLIGNPIRAKLTDNFLRSRAEHAKFTVLVFGGSLGAKRVNALMLEALDQLGDLKEGMRFVHQTGKADLESVKQGYAARGFDAEVVEFIDDMSSAYATADLVVCRAGATTVAELTVCKKAAILIPYPYATDNHQEVNARSLVDAGAALMFRESELTGQILATNIRGLKASPDRLRRMEKQAGLLGRPEAAKELADVCVQMMVQTWGPHGRSRPDKEPKKGKEAA
ncbi:MAG TPA: undecaprenyldiphospho-muramoylpentapeptide beta-N-acetylglucosaminyltransferase [Myxococcaceae bacterium]|nr:undecaprenyldiphospho-muramoylpentapeptide beta-N-acetylglucosaminyltransferase [Myxococcaceae bacterium]